MWCQFLDLVAISSLFWYKWLWLCRTQDNESQGFAYPLCGGMHQIISLILFLYLQLHMHCYVIILRWFDCLYWFSIAFCKIEWRGCVVSCLLLFCSNDFSSLFFSHNWFKFLSLSLMCWKKNALNIFISVSVCTPCSSHIKNNWNWRYLEIYSWSCGLLIVQHFCICAIEIVIYQDWRISVSINLLNWDLFLGGELKMAMQVTIMRQF